uniref:Uncharacterized protein n=1 Tax=Anguilla anguilla TaxID=7936 RepID=A0A0E9WVH5_ANGAN
MMNQCITCREQRFLLNGLPAKLYTRETIPDFLSLSLTLSLTFFLITSQGLGNIVPMQQKKCLMI